MRNEDAIGEKESDQSDLSSLTAYFAGLCEWCTSPRTPDDRFCAPCRRQVDREFAGEVVG